MVGRSWNAIASERLFRSSICHRLLLVLDGVALDGILVYKFCSPTTVLSRSGFTNTRLVNIGMPLAIYCGKASVQPFALALIVYPLLYRVSSCCSLSKSTGRMGSLFIDINESPNHQTWTTTKLLPILACFG